MSEAVYGPILLAGVAALFGWVLVTGFRSGTMEWGYFGLYFSGNRKTEPGKFWAATALNAFPFCVGVLGTVAFVFWPPGIGS
jgi:hypothetical protein